MTKENTYKELHDKLVVNMDNYVNDGYYSINDLFDLLVAYDYELERKGC